MSKALDIAINVFWLIAILGCSGWLFVRAFKRSADPTGLVIKWILTAVALYFETAISIPAFRLGGPDALFALLVTGVFGIVMAAIWRHSITDIVGDWFSSLYDGGTEPPVPKPYYSVTIARRKLNHPLEAIVAVREQLAKFPNDYEGILLLAAIQAEDTGDLSSAEMTLNHFCDAPGSPPKQVAAALTQLADWHLKFAQDIDSARNALEKIIARFPDTILSANAAQRIARLGGTEKILLAARDRQQVAVPKALKSLGLRDSTHDLVPKEDDPEGLAAEFVKHLEKHPLDTEVREKLAILYAGHYRRMDLAANELNQLIEMPGQPPRRVAHWLNLLADLQIRAGENSETVRPVLEQIIARNRLNHLELEIRGQEKESAPVKLGVHEQNIGLKYGSSSGFGL